jgi:hypothetical protein
VPQGKPSKHSHACPMPSTPLSPPLQPRSSTTSWVLVCAYFYDYPALKVDYTLTPPLVTYWYVRYFYDYPALKVDYTLTPPLVIPSSQSSKTVRMSTMMCPSTPFPCDCQVSVMVCTVPCLRSRWGGGGAPSLP